MTENSKPFSCECKKYKCEEFAEGSMVTTEKDTGRVVQAVEAIVKNCIAEPVLPKIDPRRYDEKMWDGDNPGEK